MVKNTSKPKGVVAMISLLVVASVATFFAINMLMDGLDNAVLSNNSIRYEYARINAITCLEDTLLRIKRNAQFTQSISYNLATDESCSTVATWFAENPVGNGMTEQLATLDVTGLSRGFSRTFRYELRIRKFNVHDVDESLKYTKNIDFISLTEI